MLFYFIKWIILSLSLIILLHYLYIYFIDTLTVPKVKDLINKPLEQYNEIINDIDTKNIKNVAKQEVSMELNKTNDINEMQNELTQFLNNMKETEIVSSGSLNTENYSIF